LYEHLSIIEDSGKRIGLFRILCAIFGGLLVAYLGMTLLAVIIPENTGEAIILPLLFNTLVWSSTALWIALSSSKLIALLRCFVPSVIFAILLYILY
jgi:hypothetical protein